MKHIETLENIKEHILKIEQSYPVDLWTINGIHLWPYIRIKLFINLLDKDKANKIPVANLTTKTKTKSSLKFLKLLSIIPAFVRLQAFYIKLKPKNNLLFGAHFHRVLQDGNYFNRFYDSIIDHHNLQNEVYVLEYARINENTYNKKAIIPLTKILKDYKLVSKLSGKFSKNELNINLNNFDEFYQDLLLYGINVDTIKISKSDLIKWVSKVESLEQFYHRIFNKTKPKKVVFLGYYGYDDLYGALILANKLNIKTIDFQHGPQTNVHMAYASWLKVPTEGYNTMPVEFWNWDEKSKQNIDNWTYNTSNVKSRVVGQPYVPYWLSKLIKNQEEEKVILYSLQTSPLNLFTPKLISIIKKSGYKWVLRLHPRNNTSLDDINAYLVEHELEEYTIIQDPIKVPLPKVFSNSVFHITNYSGCLIEAQMMGVPTVLIHNLGFEVFELYIDDKSVYYLDQEEKDFESKLFKLIKEFEERNNEAKSKEVINPFV